MLSAAAAAPPAAPAPRASCSRTFVVSMGSVASSATHAAAPPHRKVAYAGSVGVCIATGAEKARDKRASKGRARARGGAF